MKSLLYNNKIIMNKKIISIIIIWFCLLILWCEKNITPNQSSLSSTWTTQIETTGNLDNKIESQTLFDNIDYIDNNIESEILFDDFHNDVLYKIYSTENIDSMDRKFEGISFIIDMEKSLLMTNRHVIDNKDRFLFVCDLKDFCADIDNIWFDDDKDLAIFKINRSLENQLEILTWSDIKEWENLYLPRIIDDNSISWEEIKVVGNDILYDNTVLKLDIESKKGMSGSPIINKHKEAIGVLQAKDNIDQNISYAILF